MVLIAIGLQCEKKTSHSVYMQIRLSLVSVLLPDCDGDLVNYQIVT